MIKWIELYKLDLLEVRKWEIKCEGQGKNILKEQSENLLWKKCRGDIMKWHY